MNLNKKIIFSLLGSIYFMATINIVSFYFLYNIYFSDYLKAKNISKNEVSIEYINEIIKKQAIEEVDNIFNDIELQLFEILDKNNGTIPLNKPENINLLINYLTKAGVTPKYIEEIIPENYLNKLLADIKDKKTPEYQFFINIVYKIIIINILGITLLILALFLFSKVIIKPIKNAAEKIRTLKLGKDFQTIEYNKKDEIGYLVNAINGLNIKLNIGEKIRNRMLADISHELKTPISSIQCYLEGIKDGVIKLDDKTLDSILNEMQRLIKLVNMIMEYENFENGNVKLNLKNEDVRYITEGVVNQFRQKLKINNQKVITSGLSKHFKTDKDSYIQIVQNIISNFIKYAGKDTILKIEFGVNFIRFSDNGVGISKYEIPYITEKFYQGKNKKVGDIDNRGIGVGFSVIKKLVELIGWELEIISDEGKGFEIKIITKTSH